ncbi:MAG: tRNA (N(6)-L-threonylcarbamoyladenosine(37)-C(2))-methylthiotransferase MtaB [Oscillospiraceae bacterium]|nr:tRNA (N(6)-L-threonylcarbamoyladenosine(37)-C(2))-methylthiotransferase MtaB [Oscillospiraceae bacterium]
MKFRTLTLGCKVNQCETRALEQYLTAAGGCECGENDSPDIVIVNTCAVTAESGRKSRQAIRRLRAEHPDALLCVAGCYSQIASGEMEGLSTDVIFGSSAGKDFADAIIRAYNLKTKEFNIDDPFKRRYFEALPGGNPEGRTRAYMKIEDGCDNFCSYCIIPYSRGRVRSLPVKDAAADAKRLSEQGFRELVVTGIEISSYGKDLPGHPTLGDVIYAIAKESPASRIRLGSIEPTVITEDFARKLRDARGICPHFHLSLQSGCDRTLSAMNRKYNTERFYKAAEILREYFPGCALTADLICGFPGESEEDFAETLAFLRKCAFAAVHVFPYSVREGTKAEKLPGHLSNAVKADRASRAGKTALELKKAYLEAQVGRILPVLFETQGSDGSFKGHSDNYCEVSAPGDKLRGEERNVLITALSADGEGLVGEITGDRAE